MARLPNRVDLTRRQHKREVKPAGGDANYADPALLAAALAFAGAAAVGSATAIRDQIPGRPLGLSIPLSVRTGLLVGWGAGVAAPWPMPAAAAVAAANAQRAGGRGYSGAVCAAVGLGCIVGTAIEPVSWRWRSWSSLTRVAIACNMAASAALVVTGLAHLAARRAGAGAAGHRPVTRTRQAA